MLELHTWGTTNGRRPIIMLEETALPYKLVPVDIKAGANRSADHLAISPYGKIPALVDTDAGGKRATIFESTAILLHLADKTGKLIGANAAERADVYKWLQFSVANVLPTFAIMRQHKELEPTAEKLLDVLEGQLSRHAFIAGSAYSIADITPVTRLVQFADHPWMKARPKVADWLHRITSRPAVKKALEMPIG